MSEFYDVLDLEIEEQSQDDRRLAYISKYRREFILCPAFIQTKDNLPNLVWNTIKFNDPTPNLPEHQGVYAFSINIEHGSLPSNSYILYVGKAGDTTSNNRIDKNKLLFRYKRKTV